jgi:hypothetical protein
MVEMGKVVKYLVYGAIAAVAPGLVSKFLPGLSGMMLGFALLAGSLVLAKMNIPYAAPALGIAGGMVLVGGFAQNLVGSLTGGIAADSTTANF